MIERKARRETLEQFLARGGTITRIPQQTAEQVMRQWLAPVTTRRRRKNAKRTFNKMGPDGVVPW